MASSQSATAGHTTRRFSLDEDRDIESVPEVDTFTPDERTALLADIPHGDHGHTHSHGSMNMRGLFLHVVGDMLGAPGPFLVPYKLTPNVLKGMWELLRRV